MENSKAPNFYFLMLKLAFGVVKLLIFDK